MKILKHFQPQKCGMHKSIKLNYFEHINILESCNQPGIDNKSSYFVPEMVSCLEIKFNLFTKKNKKIKTSIFFPSHLSSSDLVHVMFPEMEIKKLEQFFNY